VGSSVRLGFLRDGKPQTATVIIGDRASLFSGDAPVAEARNRADRPGAAAGTSTHIGITVESLTAQMRRQLPPQQNGVLVTDVQPESIASAAGLKEGYVVTSIVTGGRPAPINSVADFNAIESRLKSGSSLVVYALVPQPGGLEEIGFPMKLK